MYKVLVFEVTILLNLVGMEISMLGEVDDTPGAVAKQLSAEFT
jgi:hypothetical protein